MYIVFVNSTVLSNNLSLYSFPANNGAPFRFRIGSVKSAQLFQLSAENFFRLRYESVPLQWYVNGTDVGTKVKPNRIKFGWNKRFRFGSELSRCADVTLFFRNFGRIVPSLCQRDTICSDFRQNCAEFETILCRDVPSLTLFVRNFGRIVPTLRLFVRNFGRIVPTLRLFVRNFGRIVPTLRLFYAELCRFCDYFSAELCRFCDYFSAELCRPCAEFQTIFAQIKLYQICVDLCYFRSTTS